MNRFGLGERGTPQPLAGPDEDTPTTPLLTLAFLHYWDKGQRVPADMAARPPAHRHQFKRVLFDETFTIEGYAKGVAPEADQRLPCYHRTTNPDRS
jgi:hypothetical protein